MSARFCAIACSLVLVGGPGCGVDEVPFGLRRTPEGNGATVRYDPHAELLSAVPFPNDTLCFPDPTSRTGVRLNLRTVGPTQLERAMRERLNALEGWSTFAPITVSFERPVVVSEQTVAEEAGAVSPVLDLDNIRDRHQDDDYEFEDDAVYLVNLQTGIPVPLELGSGSFRYALARSDRYGPNDPRDTEPSLLWETADETADPATGRTSSARSEYEPGFDSDFDGVLDRPNLGDQAACANQVDALLGNVARDDRDRCIADNLLFWYERETDTLVLRPLLPLAARTQYAVVLTDRLQDSAGNPIRSPFDFVYHPSQREAVEQLRRHLTSPELARRSRYYGDLAGTGLDHVAFTWSFTTGPGVDDLRLLRDGLAGHGAAAWLAREFAPQLQAAHAAGIEPSRAGGDGSAQPSGWQERTECQAIADRPYLVRLSELLPLWEGLGYEALGLQSQPQKTALLQALSAVDHLVVADYASPWLVQGGPAAIRSDSSLTLNPRTGEGTAEPDRVQVFIAVPKPSRDWTQPFGVTLYAHGWGGCALDMLRVAGELARSGLATVSFNAPRHGPSAEQRELLARLFEGTCYVPAATVGGRGRARDCDRDGSRADESGCAFWSADPMHTRNLLQQTVIDSLQLLRVLKGFGEQRGVQDYDGDGRAELAGDFDADGVADLGGPQSLYTAWGESLGGLAVVPLGALDPDLVATAVLGGGGSLFDVLRRTQDDSLVQSFLLPALGLTLIGVPAGQLESGTTQCAPDEVSLRFIVTTQLRSESIEFWCLEVQDPTQGVGLPSGGTVVLSNGGNGERNCCKMAPDGSFRVNIAADAGDRLELQVYDEPDVVDSYAAGSGCNVTDTARRIAIVNTWGRGPIQHGRTAATGQPVCTAVGGCTEFAGELFGAGTPLVAPQSGLGLVRQSPGLREYFGLVQQALDGTDGINFARHYGLAPLPGPGGAPARATAALVLAPVGDQTLPIDSQVAVARAMGTVPFLRPDAAARYPAHADYVTPTQLFLQLGELTPNRILVTQHVLEGIGRFHRHPSAEGCSANQLVPHEPDACHPACTADSDCAPDSYCDAASGACRMAAPAQEQCAALLFDPDALDEGLAGTGQQSATMPLRLARIAAPAAPSQITERWEPRLAGSPSVPDQGAWAADRRTLALLFPYLHPHGEPLLSAVDPCEAFSTDRYVRHLIGRFLQTQGADPYYLSHPATHQCLARGDCGVLAPLD